MIRTRILTHTFYRTKYTDLIATSPAAFRLLFTKYSASPGCGILKEVVAACPAFGDVDDVSGEQRKRERSEGDRDLPREA